MTVVQDELPSPIEIFWVLGCGKFGRRAVRHLRKAAPTSKIIVVDRQPVKDLPNDIDIVCADGVEWLAENFTPDADVSKIIPALPVHLAAEWLKKKLSEKNRFVRSIEIFDEQLQQLPNPVRLSRSRAVISHADFLCPPYCSEPDDICTFTQKQRPPSLYHILETKVYGNFVPLILKSRQFFPGVGGFFPEDLRKLFDHAQLLSDTPLLIGTACRCHGIVDGISHTRQQSSI